MEYSVNSIIRSGDTSWDLKLFSQEEIEAIDLFEKRGKPYVKCIISGLDRPAKPEEIVRQLFLIKLINEYGYPKERIAVEKGVYFGSTIHEKRADIVVYDKDHSDTEYIIIELKKPKRKDGLEQVKSYCNALGSPIAVWTNGGEIIVLHRDDPNDYSNLPDIPHANQTLSELLNEPWLLDDLKARNVLDKTQATLKSIVLDIEDLVLANAGVNSFEEVFKLIFAKLYDEWASAHSRKARYLQFRNTGTSQEVYDRINELFLEAQTQWEGVFRKGEEIDLTPDHLKTCVSFLEEVKLFNSNLQVIDEAFEYLSVKDAKGEKGQYFTPRHVIDMAVKMLDPKEDEYVIDTAAGSCGFTVHSIFHVWGNQFEASGPNDWQKEYARKYVYAIDFDPRSIKIAKALNLIAGDGKTNVYRANTLDPRHWDEETKLGLKSRLRLTDKTSEDKENKEQYRYFDFDIMLTNPPFAGDIKDARILHQYELAAKWNAIDPDNSEEVKVFQKRYFEKGTKWNIQQSRDTLFIERNLQFLKPGGRAAIVLPQGRFNNPSDEYLRRYISKHARILAVIGLHINTFKPHTNTKTSVLFLQKWNDDRKKGHFCPYVEDYPIFFGSSQNSGKNNNGGNNYCLDTDGNRLYDLHGHPIVDHDLYSERAIIQSQWEVLKKRYQDDKPLLKVKQAEYKHLMATLPDRPTIQEAFWEFACRHKLSFAERS